MTALIRAAAPHDVEAIHALIRELAVFEKLEDMLVATPAQLGEALFGARPAVEALVAEMPASAGEPARVVSYALFFHNYSTFLGRRGLYLEDLYVQPSQRGTGLGTRMLRALASIAIERGCGRFEWTVLDWNVNAIAFYEKMGGTILPEWRVVRVTGEALTQLASV